MAINVPLTLLKIDFVHATKAYLVTNTDYDVRQLMTDHCKPSNMETSSVLFVVFFLRQRSGLRGELYVVLLRLMARTKRH